MTIELDEIIRNLNEDKSLNFIGLAITIHQTDGIDVAVSKLRNEGVTPRGFVLLLPHSQTGRMLNESDFFFLDDNICVYDFDYSFNVIKKPNPVVERVYAIKSSKKDIHERIIYVAISYINYQWLYLIEKNVPWSKVKYILIDDGDGSYANNYRDTLQFEIYNNPKQSYLKSVLKVRLIATFNSVYLRHLRRTNGLVDNRLFVCSGSGKKKTFIRNDSVSGLYDDVYRKIGETVPRSILDLVQHSVLINTLCLKENNITDGVVDFLLYKELVERITAMGIKVVIKPHPREQNIEKYDTLGCQMIRGVSYSQEAILAGTKEKPCCVIGLFSSTLLNVKGVFGIPAISLARILERNESISPVFRRQLNDYIVRYEGIIEFPDTMDKAIQLIYKLYRR